MAVKEFQASFDDRACRRDGRFAGLTEFDWVQRRDGFCAATPSFLPQVSSSSNRGVSRGWM